MDITNLQPSNVWKNFAALNSVPRPSKKEGKVIEFIRQFGVSLGLETTVDETGNVLIRKPATQGMEDHKTVVLQSHLDMVCQKNNETDFDFDSQGIKMLVDGDWVKADGTTLGADNGIGVASIMSVLESDSIPHPALEALFTIDEETGMTGAFGLKPNFLKGHILLNLDTEEDDEIDIGCAGGMDVTARREYSTELLQGSGFNITIKGLQGGHSGIDIHLGRGNANVIMARLLMAGLPYNIQLLSMDGGSLRNAIPREAKAQFVVVDSSKFLVEVEKLKISILNEFKSIEKSLEIVISETSVSAKGLSVEDTMYLVRAMKAAHNGVYRMSPDVKDLVEASNNIARVKLEEGKLEIMCLTRSSVDSTKEDVALQLQAVFNLAGMQVAFTGSYPGWQPNPHSSIVSLMERIYTQLFGESPKVVACHAGLECGIIGAHYPNMEMVSFGPTIYGAHSPDERVSISSVQKFWGFLLNILNEIPKR